MKIIALPSMMYFEDKTSQRFKSLASMQVFHDIFHWLCAENQVEKMIESTQNNRPAMEGIIEALEKQFNESNGLNLLENMRHRQIIGSMIRYIMGHYHYFVSSSKPLRKGCYIRTAIQFKYIRND